MAHAIDYQTLIDTVQFGIAEPSNSILPKGALFWNPDQVSPEFDLDKARGFLVKLAKRSGRTETGLLDTHPAGPERVASWDRAVQQIKASNGQLPKRQ